MEEYGGIYIGPMVSKNLLREMASRNVLTPVKHLMFSFLI